MTTRLLVVTDDTTPESLTAAIANLNAEAKKLSRRGWVGTQTAEYAHRHEQMDALVRELLTKSAGTTTRRT